MYSGRRPRPVAIGGIVRIPIDYMSYALMLSGYVTLLYLIPCWKIHRMTTRPTLLVNSIYKAFGHLQSSLCAIGGCPLSHRVPSWHEKVSVHDSHHAKRSRKSSFRELTETIALDFVLALICLKLLMVNKLWLRLIQLDIVVVMLLLMLVLRCW